VSLCALRAPPTNIGYENNPALTSSVDSFVLSEMSQRMAEMENNLTIRQSLFVAHLIVQKTTC
jgi:hypothetical protein